MNINNINNFISTNINFINQQEYMDELISMILIYTNSLTPNQNNYAITGNRALNKYLKNTISKNSWENQHTDWYILCSYTFYQNFINVLLHQINGIGGEYKEYILQYKTYLEGFVEIKLNNYKIYMEVWNDEHINSNKFEINIFNNLIYVSLEYYLMECLNLNENLQYYSIQNDIMSNNLNNFKQIKKDNFNFNSGYLINLQIDNLTDEYKNVLMDKCNQNNIEYISLFDINNNEILYFCKNVDDYEDIGKIPANSLLNNIKNAHINYKVDYIYNLHKLTRMVSKSRGMNIYLFGEYHITATNRCVNFGDINSVKLNIDQFLVNQIKYVSMFGKIIDLYIEMPYINKENQTKQQGNTYMQYFDDKIHNCLTVDKKDCKYKNLRAHYVDVRLGFVNHYSFNELLKIKQTLYNAKYWFTSLEKLEDVMTVMSELYKNIETFLNNWNNLPDSEKTKYKNKDSFINIITKELDEQMKINKQLENIKDVSLRNKIYDKTLNMLFIPVVNNIWYKYETEYNTNFFTYYVNYINYIKEKIVFYLNNINSNPNEVVDEINNFNNTVNSDFIDLTMYFMDIYTIARMFRDFNPKQTDDIWGNSISGKPKNINYICRKCTYR